MAWDVIIVGARCAGAVMAMSLARRGAKVLALDRARFPSDTLSTHNFNRETAARFRELGVLDAIGATGAPPLRRMRFVAPGAGVEYTGTFQPVDGLDAGYCVRRVLLDDILVQAARAAGAEVREATSVTGLVWDGERAAGVTIRSDSGAAGEERARFVVGADGRHSQVARWVQAPVAVYEQAITPAYFGYFRNVHGQRDVIELFRGNRRDYLVLPTDNELTCVLVALTQAEIGEYRAAYRESFFADLQAVPELAERLRDSELVGRIQGAADLESYLRVPWGPGWALVGDAGAHMHPVNAVGIGLAVRDGMALADALTAALGGPAPEQEALERFHERRDAHSEPVLRASLAAARATGTPVPPRQLAFWSALARLPEDADRVVSGLVRSPEEMAAIMQRANRMA